MNISYKYNFKYSYDYVKKFFEQNGCILISDKYSTVNDELEYICKCGNKAKRRFFFFIKSPRCRKCKNKPKSGPYKRPKLTKEYVSKYFSDNGCELVDVQEPIVARHTKIKYRCTCGNISSILWGNFKAGKRCRKCGIRKVSGENNYLYRRDKETQLQEIKFRKRCYSMIQESVKYFDYKKIDKTHKILGYSPADLENHIKNHPNWKNVDPNKFNIDHIFPIKAFIDHNIYDLSIINCLENLQPLDPLENVSKNDYYNEEKFKNWLLTKGIII